MMDTTTRTRTKALLLGMLREEEATEKSVMAEAVKLCDGDKTLGQEILAEVCGEVVDA